MPLNEIELAELSALADAHTQHAESSLLDLMQSHTLQTFDFESFSGVLNAAESVIREPASNPAYSKITDWAMARYQLEENDNAAKYAERILNWLNQKLELLEEPENSAESRLSLKLYRDMIQCGGTQHANSLVNCYQGLATFALSVGLAEENHDLVNEAIAAQREVLSLYQTGQFPDYYNLAGFIARAKRDLAKTMMDALEFDQLAFAGLRQEAQDLIYSAFDEITESGTDFDIEYTFKLLQRFEGEIP